MLHKVIKGYTVVSHFHSAADGLYWILGNRRLGPETYEWLVVGLRHIDDDEWFMSGFYTLDLTKAIERFESERDYR